MHIKYNQRPGHFTWEELRVLSFAVGFSVNLFENCLPLEIRKSKDALSIKELNKYFDDRYFYHQLHFTSNLKTATYNTSVFKKAAMMISKRFLSFEEVQNVRLAFETYESYDQRGMFIDERTFLRTLKLCGRIISPKKLMHKIGHLKSEFKEEGRIQLFEFIDLLVLCELFEAHKSDGDQSDISPPVAKTWTNLYKVDNFNQLMIPQDKKIWRYLNQKYKSEELKHNLKPEWTSEKFTENPVDADDFHTQVKLSNKGYETLQKKLKNSSRDIKRAQGGFGPTRPQTAPLRANAGRHKDKVRLVKSAFTVDDSFHKSKRKPRKFRPMSSPPVVNYDTARDCDEKIDRVKFDLLTEKARWKQHYHDTMTEYLPNHQEVLRRMYKPPRAPRAKKHFRKQRPSTATIHRLTDTTPKLPIQHMKSCDALMQGTPNDTRSSSLRKQALYHCKSPKPVRTNRYRKSRSRNSNLLQALMKQFGYESESSDEEKDKKETAIKVNKRDNVKPKSIKTEHVKGIENNLKEELGEPTGKPATDIEKEDIKQQPPAEDVENKSSVTSRLQWEKRDRQKEIMELLTDDFQRVYLKTKAENEKEFVMEDLYYTEYLSDTDKAKIEPPSCPKKEEKKHCNILKEDLSDFEKYVRDPKNLQISNSKLFKNGNVQSTISEKRKKKAMKRISSLYKEIKEEKK